MLRIYSQSLGCPKNRVDTERLLGSLGKPSLGEPVLTVSEPEEADLVFINTCAFIGPAVEESVRTIVQMAADLEDLPERPFFVVVCPAVTAWRNWLERSPRLTCGCTPPMWMPGPPCWPTH